LGECPRCGVVLWTLLAAPHTRSRNSWWCATCGLPVVRVVCAGVVVVLVAVSRRGGVVCGGYWAESRRDVWGSGGVPLPTAGVFRCAL